LLTRELPVYPYGAPAISGILKSTPADFQVSEELGFEPGGEGEHCFLLVEKTGLSTPELITRVAQDFSLHPRLVSHSGLKDKHARTSQWLSLHLPGKSLPARKSAGDGYRILRQARHHRKLRPGTHKCNVFQLCLREVEELPDQTIVQINLLTSRGFANYFGAQRFGRRQDNVKQALLKLQNRRLQRSRKSILVSSLRSYLFNQILTRRIGLGHWEKPLAGDVFMLSGSRSVFTDEINDDLLARYQQLDISSTASLYGEGRNQMADQAQAIEEQVFAQHEDITACLDRQGAKLQMRALRAVVGDFSYDYDAEKRNLRLNLTLPAGSYVTTMLEHFINLKDVS
jgi:tRNA pseudouridine13 synthase